tara:strand:+ start:2936 stop:4216 length:1281 start_codon:yes stop_codon:yes gene_type:complete
MDNQEESIQKTAKEYQEQGIRDRKEGNYHDGIENLNKAIELDPSDGSSFANLGYCRQLLEDYDEAINNYNQAIKLVNNDESFYNNRGCCYEELGEYGEAIKDYTRAISLKPEEIILFLNRAEVSMKIGHYHVAIADYSHYLFSYPTCSDVYVKRGKANLRYSRRLKAKADWMVAADLGNQEASRLLLEHFTRPVSYTSSETYSYNRINPTSGYQVGNRTESYNYRNQFDSYSYSRFYSLEYLYTKAINNCVDKKQIHPPSAITNQVNPKALEDLSIVITGTIPDMTRKEVESIVKEAGGIIKGSISSKTNLLIAGEDAGSKLEKAKASGIQVINKEQLMSRIKIKSTRELLMVWSKLSEEETLKKLETEAVPNDILNLLVKCNSYKIRKATYFNQNTSLGTFAKSSLYKDSSTRLWKFILKKWGTL